MVVPVNSLVGSFVFVLAVHRIRFGDRFRCSGRVLSARYRVFGLIAEKFSIGSDPAFDRRLSDVPRGDVIDEDGLVLQRRDRCFRVGCGRHRAFRLRGGEQRHAGCNEQQV